MNQTPQDNATAPALLPAAGLLCGCGRPVQYSHGDKRSCNKRVVCPTYDELREQLYRANALVMAYREKRKWDGLNGRTWNASKHFEAEARIEELESHNDHALALPPLTTKDHEKETNTNEAKTRRQEESWWQLSSSDLFADSGAEALAG